MSKIEQDEIDKAFEEAYENDEVTDVMGNKLSKDDFTTYDLPIKRDIPFDAAINALKRLQGEVLTIVDASPLDERKGKFVKDLIKGSFAKTGDFYTGFVVENVEIVNK